MINEDINDLYLDILRKLQETGEVKAKRREVIFLTFTLTDMDKNVLFFPFAQRNWPWILREASDRIFNVANPGTAFNYSKNWENRIEESGFFSYHYADRLNSQMQDVLAKRIQSRDKIVQVWKEGDYELTGRQPCTITMQPVMEHDNKMSLIVYMRNNDMINIFPSDVFIHSTYFKYWAARRGLEYKNLYWIAAVAYYQKKRDKLEFSQRLLQQWSQNYSNLKTTKWDIELTDELAYKEEVEESLRGGSSLQQAIDSSYLFKSDYAREWLLIMLLAYAKKNKQVEEFEHIYRLPWITEFSLLKESITPPK